MGAAPILGLEPVPPRAPLPGRRHLIPEPQKGRSQVLAMISPGVLGWASVSRSHSSPAVSPLPAGAMARRDLCLDQAVVLIEDAIQVGGPALALGLMGAAGPAGPFILPSWGQAAVAGLCGHHPRADRDLGLGPLQPSLGDMCQVPFWVPGHSFRRFTICPGPVVCCTVLGFLKMSRGGTTFLRLQTTPRVNPGDRLWKPALLHVGDEAGGILQGGPAEVGWGRPCTDVR